MDLGEAQGLERAGDPSGAAALARAVRERLEARDADDWRLGTVDAYLAQLVEGHPEVAGDEDAEALYRRAIEDLGPAPGNVQLQRAMAMRKLALLLEGQGRAEEAAHWTRRSHALLRETLPPEHPLWEAGEADAVLRQGRALGELVAVELGVEMPAP